MDAFQAKAGKQGFLIFGPYVSVEAGRYMATFRVSVNHSARPILPTVCGWVDVAVGGQTIAQTMLYDTRLIASPFVTLPFELSETATNVEFRVITSGRLPLIARFPTFEPIGAEEARYHPAFPLRVEPKSPFILEHLPSFRELHEEGANLDEDAVGPYVGFGPLRFGITSTDDFQLIREILLNNEYNFITGRKSIFIDIGMNAGLTSIQAAYKPNVTAVHGFEPFEAPYKKALMNIARNSAVRGKIHTYNFGLSDFNGPLQVNESADTTIGNSIRGRETGTPTTIQIRDTVDALSDIITQANSRGENVVMKVDCEGSEFAIMKRLDEAKLLPQIRSFVIEWHRWWNPDLNHVTLTEPLLRNGYEVFDRSVASNLHAGMLYAVRG
ncbi:MAG: FkbM family methyltransferase [Reyranella sp.]|nr:MAG: FkbM family methyltransferase [Reyranella sp.]